MECNWCKKSKKKAQMVDTTEWPKSLWGKICIKCYDELHKEKSEK